MPLTAGQPAMMVARLGTMRLGASRLGYYEPIVTITINGVVLTGAAKALAVAGLSITDNEGGTPNTATLMVTGVTPVHGQEIRIGLGGLGRGQIIFAGHILQATQVYVGGASNIHYALSCISYEWLLNDRPISGKFLSTSATDIVLWIMSGATGFSTAGVEAGLPSLDEITFTNVDRADALDRVKTRIGGAWVVDYASPPVLHFGLSIRPWSSAIHPITTADPHGMEKIAKTIDLSQVRTRIEVEGGGANATAQVPAGTTTIPIEDPVWYLGGVVVSGPQRITYAGTVTGGAGALVGTTLTPTNGPTVTGRATSGMTAGARDWAVTFGTGAGKTLPSPVTAHTVGGAVPAPTSAPTAGTPTAGGDVDAGNHDYAVAFVTDVGETALSPIGNQVATLAAVSDPSAISSSNGNFADANSSFAGTGILQWGFTFRRLSDGAETALSPIDSFGPIDWSATPMFRQVSLTGCSTPPSGYVRQWYRTTVGGSTFKRIPVDGTSVDAQPTKLQGVEANGLFIDHCADGALGANAPGSNGTGTHTIALTGIPIGPVGITERNLYRRFNGTGTFKRVTNLNNNTDTTYTDTNANADLGPDALTTATALALSADLGNIPLGPTGTTYRDLWRTEEAGSQLKFLATLANNTTTVLTDTAADGSLGANIHTTDTSGLVAESGEVPAGSTSLMVTATAPFQAGGGWALIGALSVLYTGVSGTSLTGIPSSGVGSLGTTLRYGSEVIAAHMLTGIPASGAGSILYDILAGDPVNILVTRNDATAQAVMAALLTTPTRTHDGILVEPIQDRRLSQVECENRGDARLAEVKDPLVALSYQTPDLTHHSGREVTFALDAPTNITGDFKVQRVTLSQFEGGRSRPIRTVDASSRRLSFDAILRIVKGKAA